MKSVSELIDIKRKVEDRILDQYENACAVGVGKKEQGGKKQNRLALVVYVQTKLARSELADDQCIDRDEQLLDELDHNRDDLDIKQIGEIRALFAWPVIEPLIAERERRVRPVAGGYSEGHFAITAGTGGVIVATAEIPKPQQKDEWYRLSNNHVYANANDARPSDQILQPGPHDGGRLPGDIVGYLERWQHIYWDRDNLVDAAIRTLEYDEKLLIEGLGEPTGRGTATIDMDVVKSGRTTGVRYGVVEDILATVDVSYGNGKVARFRDQIIVTTDAPPFSQGGDSGSAVFESQTDQPVLRWVGLLFAGNQQGTYTICNHAADVERTLGVRLVPGEYTEPPEPPNGGGGCGSLFLAAFVAAAAALLSLAFFALF